jgi:hypothetical protein
MMIGKQDIFAIESSIFEAYEGLGQMALGCFVIHVGGRGFGFRDPDATILATAFNGVRRRIAERGSHRSPLPTDADAARIALAFSHQNYMGKVDDAELYGIQWPQFFKALNSNGCVWAPDGEEGFDDCSRVLQFDENDTVRLIAFHDTVGYQVDAGSLRDVRLPQDDFYKILQEWHTRFESEWMSRPKVA